MRFLHLMVCEQYLDIKLHIIYCLSISRFCEKDLDDYVRMIFALFSGRNPPLFYRISPGEGPEGTRAPGGTEPGDLSQTAFRHVSPAEIENGLL